MGLKIANVLDISSARSMASHARYASGSVADDFPNHATAPVGVSAVRTQQCIVDCMGAGYSGLLARDPAAGSLLDQSQGVDKLET